jgi:hypothetical protein
MLAPTGSGRTRNGTAERILNLCRRPVRLPSMRPAATWPAESRGNPSFPALPEALTSCDSSPEIEQLRVVIVRLTCLSSGPASGPVLSVSGLARSWRADHEHGTLPPGREAIGPSAHRLAPPRRRFQLALFPDATCRFRQTHEVVLWATVQALLRRQWITEPSYPLFSDPDAGSITERGRAALRRK